MCAGVYVVVKITFLRQKLPKLKKNHIVINSAEKNVGTTSDQVPHFNLQKLCMKKKKNNWTENIRGFRWIIQYFGCFYFVLKRYTHTS